MSLKRTAACLGYQQLTPTVSTALTVPATATYAIIQAEAQAIRWRDDGVAPTAAIGMTIAAGGELRYDGNLSAIRFIEAVALSKLNVSYYC
jgi:hypothetical protein